MKNLFLLPALMVGLALIAATTNCLHAATFSVTTTNISGPGSLPVAIAQANATPGDNQIQISVTNPITLGLTLATITNNVAIMGTASAPSIISGGGTLPLFTFAAGTTNSLSNLVLANGYTANSGAAISNASTLSVSGCVITNDIATNSLFGGAIINSGVMIISSSVIANNQAGIGASFYNSVGGAIYNSGTIILNNSQLLNNQAGNAGAIFNAGTLVVNNLIVSNNFADAGFGGGIYNTGSLTISMSAFIGNAAVGASGQGAGTVVNGGNGGGGGGGGGFGGALFSSSGNVGITNSTFFLNTANGGGGGVANFEVVFNNGNGGNGGGSAGGSGGISGSQGTPGASGGFGSGGGGGGGGGSPFVAVGGSGGFGGGAGGAGGGEGVSGSGGSGIGGAIFIQTGTLSLVNCTIASNLCWQGPCYGGGVFNYSGNVTLLNTIVAGNSATTSSPDLMGTFSSSGSNLIGNNQGATNLSILDFQNVSANLSTLQNNGGSTLTCAPLSGSLAIGNGASTGAPTTDQRGVPRPQGGAFDIGAVQVVTGSPFVTAGGLVSGSGFNLNTIFDATNSYRIQVSTNLTAWVNLITNASGGAQSFTDTGATNLSRRFYRTATP